MRVNYHSPLFNLILGAVFGAVLSSAILAHLMTVSIERRMAQAETAWENAEDKARKDALHCRQDLEESNTRAAEYLRLAQGVQ